MKLLNLENSLDVIKLYLVLDSKMFLTFRELKDIFSKTKTSTLYNRLDVLVAQGHIVKNNKKELGKKILPGGDQIEIKLSQQGVQIRKLLIMKVTKILDPVIKKSSAQQIAPQNKGAEIEQKNNSKSIDKQEIIKEISVNTSQDILDILINFSQNIMDNRTDDDDSIPEMLFNKTLKEIQLIYQKEISEVI